MAIDPDVTNAVDNVPLADPNVVSLRDVTNQFILALSSPERERPIPPDDIRVVLDEPSLENLLDFLSGVRRALIQCGAAKEE